MPASLSRLRFDRCNDAAERGARDPTLLARRSRLVAIAFIMLACTLAFHAPGLRAGSKESVVRFQAERRELLVFGLEDIHTSLGLAKHELPQGGIWQKVDPGAVFYTSDAARLKILTSHGSLSQGAQVTWYERTGPTAPWAVLGHGPELSFSIPNQQGLLLLRVSVDTKGFRQSSESVQFEIKRRLCQRLYATVLDDIALGVAAFREAKATTQTYKEAWATNADQPKQIVMLPDPNDPGKQPYQLAEGDLVLRTGGPLGYVQRALGSPESPQNHSAIIKIETHNGRNIYMVNEIGWGYEYTPLTPADASAYQELKSLPERPESFMERANVGSLEVYRPVGTVQRSQGATSRWEPYPIGQVVAARAVEIGAKAQRGYDFLFMESSTLSDQPPFQDLYYCHEFTREAFGRRMTKPVPIPILQGLWQAGRACDQELAAANAQGSAHDAASLAAVLSEIDLENITFDPDAAKNEVIRHDFRQLIGYLKQFLSGESLQQIFTSKIAEELKPSSVPVLLEGLLKGSSPGEMLLPKLQQLFSKQSMADLAKSSGTPEAYVPILASAFQPAVQAWFVASQIRAGTFVSEEVYQDLGNAIDAESILQGGDAIGANGETVRVTFTRISKPSR